MAGTTTPHEDREQDDVELRLDATRDDDLNDLEDGGVERWRAHTKTARDWPKDQELAEVTNTKEGVPGPKDQEVKMGTRRRYSVSLYTMQNNSATWKPLSEWGIKGLVRTNKTTITGQWENRLGITKRTVGR